MSKRQSLFLLFILLFSVGFLLAYPVRDADWFNDDLYLVRQYSNDELTTSLVGSWQPAYLGTRGYRPLTPPFYNSIYWLSGGSPSIFRIEQILLFTLMLMALALAALELGFSRWQIAIVGLTILCTRNTWWTLVWPTDSVRLFEILFGNLALYLYLRFLKTKRLWLVVPVIVCYLIALLTREEALTYMALIPLAGYWLYRDQRRTLWFSGILIGLSLVFMIMRHFFVSDAVSTPFLVGWALQFGFAALPRLFDWVPLSIGALVVFWLLIFFAKPKRAAWLWLACAAIAAAPGIIVSRGNNSLLPVIFFALFVAAVFGQPRLLNRVALLIYLVGSIVAHQDAQLALAPNSLDRVTQAQAFTQGTWQDALPWMSEDRIEKLRADAQIKDVIAAPSIWSGW